MILFKKNADLRNYLLLKRKSGITIGFVPTMGALHEGHISLIKTSKKECGLTVASIFVNPTQFNDKSDFNNYPVTLEKDIEKLELNGCDVLFLPSVSEIYPNGVDEPFNLSFGQLEHVFEGEFRSGHFKGVGNVVSRLLYIVSPDVLYLGQKDYQQYLVIKSLVEQLKLNTRVELGPIVREPDGLAMSSRHVHLTPEERKIAPAFSKVLAELKAQAGTKPVAELRQWAQDKINQTPGMKVQYLEFVNADDLTPVTDWNDCERIIVVAVVLLGSIRMLDNVFVKG